MSPTKGFKFPVLLLVGAVIAVLIIGFVRRDGRASEPHSPAVPGKANKTVAPEGTSGRSTRKVATGPDPSVASRPDIAGKTANADLQTALPSKSTADNTSDKTRVPIVTEARATPPAGPWAQASVVVDGKSVAKNLSPDYHGTYPQIQLAPEAEAEISLRFDRATAPSQVVIQAQDGGLCLGSGKQVDLVGISPDGLANFKVKMDANPGIYRFSLHHGSSVHDLDFWVGNLPSVTP